MWQSTIGVLQGTADPLHLLFPDGSVIRTGWAVYTVARGTGLQYVGPTRCEGCHRELRRPDRRVRISGDRCRYRWDDDVRHASTSRRPSRVCLHRRVCRCFLARAEERFAQYPFMRGTRHSTIEDQPTDSIPDRLRHHLSRLTFATATVDLRQTLEHVRQRLVPGGLLLLLEGTRPERWVDLTFGMTDGWYSVSAIMTSGPKSCAARQSHMAHGPAIHRIPKRGGGPTGAGIATGRTAGASD